MKETTGKMMEIPQNSIKLEFNDSEVHKTFFYDTIINIAEEVANNHTYKLHKFDCTNFSEELKDNLLNNGFDAYCVSGTLDYSEYPLHTWVEINHFGYLYHIESVYGYIIEDSYYKEHYHPISKGRCL